MFPGFYNGVAAIFRTIEWMLDTHKYLHFEAIFVVSDISGNSSSSVASLSTFTIEVMHPSKQ